MENREEIKANDFFRDNKLIPFHTDSIHYREIYSIMDSYASIKTKALTDEIEYWKKIFAASQYELEKFKNRK